MYLSCKISVRATYAEEIKYQLLWRGVSILSIYGARKSMRANSFKKISCVGSLTMYISCNTSALLGALQLLVTVNWRAAHPVRIR